MNRVNFLPENRMLSEKQVADYFSISVTTLRRYRKHGCGPKYHKLTGATVRYHRDDVVEWMNSRVCGGQN